jgi:probable HAF family extracellular repeat protein
MGSLRIAPWALCALLCAGCGGGGAASSTSSMVGMNPQAPVSASDPMSTASDSSSASAGTTSSTMPPPPSSAAAPPAPTPAPSSDPAPLYALTDIGPFTSPGATAIDNHDNVVVAQINGNGSFYYQHSSSSVVQLEAVAPGADVVMANGINDAGNISGWSGQHAVVWKVTGGYSLLNTENAAAAQAQGINQQGVVAGSRALAHADGAPTAWDENGTETDLPGVVGGAIAVSDQGLIVGDATQSGAYPDYGPQHATAWQAREATDLGTLQGDRISSAQAVSNTGDIVGISQGDSSHAVLWHAGAITDIGSLGASGSTDASAGGINDTGEIVGRSAVGSASDGSTLYHAFLFLAGRMQDLNSLVDPSGAAASFVTLTDAAAINCNGDIAANGVDSRDQRTHAYVLVRQGSARSECPPR